MMGYDPEDDASFYADQLQQERDYADEETARADEAERLLGEALHAFKAAAPDAFAAFRAKEPGIEEVL